MKEHLTVSRKSLTESYNQTGFVSSSMNSEDDDLRIFRELLVTTGLDDFRLRSPFRQTPVTLAAPTNSAFTNLVGDVTLES
jgi:hypothetical protein